MCVEIPVDIGVSHVEGVALRVVALPHVASVRPEVRQQDGGEGGEIFLVVDNPELAVV